MSTNQMLNRWVAGTLDMMDQTGIDWNYLQRAVNAQLRARRVQAKADKLLSIPEEEFADDQTIRVLPQPERHALPDWLRIIAATEAV